MRVSEDLQLDDHVLGGYHDALPICLSRPCRVVGRYRLFISSSVHQETTSLLRVARRQRRRHRRGAVVDCSRADDGRQRRR